MSSEAVLQEHTHNEIAGRYLDGTQLWGDDFDAEQIAQWYADEERGYFNLTRSEGWMDEYVYHALNEHYAYRFLEGRHFPTCLAMGCADAQDVAPLASYIDRYIALEPAEKWWTDQIGGKPAQFIKPAVTGHIPLPDASVDLVTSLGVLHHIPNVRFVLGEIRRVLKPGGTFVMRETIFSMGDWSRPREGLTRNERGLPLPWLKCNLEPTFKVVRRSLCMFPAIPRLASRVGIVAYNSRLLTLLDDLASRLFAWNVSYHRTNVWKKLAPTSVFYVLEKV